MHAHLVYVEVVEGHALQQLLKLSIRNTHCTSRIHVTGLQVPPTAAAAAAAAAVAVAAAAAVAVAAGDCSSSIGRRSVNMCSRTVVRSQLTSFPKASTAAAKARCQMAKSGGTGAFRSRG
jgi:hypothetical protein